MGQQKIFQTRLTDVDTVQRDNLGQIRWEGNKAYKYVKFLNTTATVAGAAGDVVVYTAEDGYDDNEVCADLTDGDACPVGAGVLLATVTGTATTPYYLWIQLTGMSTLNNAIAASVDGTPVACADGNGLVVGAADKVLRRVNTVIDADAERRPEVAVAMDASAKTVILKFPF